MNLRKIERARATHITKLKIRHTLSLIVQELLSDILGFNIYEGNEKIFDALAGLIYVFRNTTDKKTLEIK